MKPISQTLAVLDGTFSVCRLAPGTKIPMRQPISGGVSVTRASEDRSPLTRAMPYLTVNGSRGVEPQ
jgi:hypothetical protein